MTRSQASFVLPKLRRAALPLDGGELSDGQLLESFVTAREEAAFAALVRRHGPMVLGVCRRVLRHRHDAEDAFQAAFLVLVRKAATVVPRASVGNWLYGVAYRTALAARTAGARRRVKERQVNDRPQAVTQDVAIENDWQRVLDEELSRLPDKYRTAIVLCELEGRTCRAAARQLRVPEGTLSSRLTTARRLLARRLTRRGVGLSGGLLTAALAEVSAAVTPELLVSATKAATAVAAGGAATALVPASVVALSEGVLKTMLLRKLKIVTVLLLLAGIVLACGHVLRQPAAAERLPGPQRSLRLLRADKDDEATPVTRVIRLEGPVDSVAWSPDGTLIALQHRREPNQEGYYLGTAVKLCDARTGEVKRTLVESGRKLQALAVAFSPDGKTLAAAQWRFAGRPHVHEVKLWNPHTGEEVGTLSADHRLHCLAFSSDGKKVAAGSAVITPQGETTGGEIYVWDAESRALLWRKEEHTNQVNGVAFSPDGKLVASASSDKTIKLFDSANGEPKQTLAGHDEPGVFSVAFAPAVAQKVAQEGKLLASGGLDGTVRLWDLSNGTLKHTLTGYAKGSIVVVAFSPDGRFLAAAGSQDQQNERSGLVRLWDPRTGKARQTLSEPLGFVRAMAVSPTGKALAIGTWDQTVKVCPVRP